MFLHMDAHQLSSDIFASPDIIQRIFAQELTGSGQTDAALRAVEKLNAQVPLKRIDLLNDRARRNKQIAGSAGKTAGVAHGQKSS